MLSHLKRLTPPSQFVNTGCGFLFDTVGIPCLRILISKPERALAIVQKLLDAPLTRQWARLSLAIAAGILESLVDATPRCIGRPHLPPPLNQT
jgi:hypothetical protein